MVQKIGRVEGGSKEKEETALQKLKKKLNIEGHKSYVDAFFEDSNFNEITSFLSGFLLDEDFCFEEMFDKLITQFDRQLEVAFSLKSTMSFEAVDKLVNVHCQGEVHLIGTHLGNANKYSKLTIACLFSESKITGCYFTFYSSNRKLKFDMTHMFDSELDDFRLDDLI